jgi:uridine kinase
MITFADPIELSKYIISISNETYPYVIAIDGFGGSGKSNLSRQLLKLLRDGLIIQTDDFIKYPHETNVFEHDWEAIENKVLKRLKEVTSVTTKTYDWHTLKAVTDEQSTIQKYILFDGIGLLEPKYLKYYNLKIWIDCPYELALERGKKRDREDQGVDHDQLWDEVWGPGSQQYFERAQPHKRADILFKTY